MEQIVETKNCQNCHKNFHVLFGDLEFYKKLLVPIPKFCPKCREQRRLAFRNERHLYKRICDLCRKNIISVYPPDSPYTVYCPSCFWSDKWDAKKYARDIDFNRPFFKQIHELWKQVPQIGIFNAKNINSEYSNYSEREKNCYLTVASNRNEDCMYSEYIWDSKNCIDCLGVEKSELLYMCVDCINLYNCFYCQNCNDSNNLWNCFDCKSCHDLLACSGLRQKSFCVLNKQYTEEDFKKITTDIQGNPEKTEEILRVFENLKAETPRFYANVLNCEESFGDNLHSCSRVYHCFNAFDLQDSRYIENCPGFSRDIIDINGCSHTELSYELVACINCYNAKFCLYALTGLKDSFYCAFSTSSHDLFGCIGMRNASYCILNKQYTREEYEVLSQKLIQHMGKTGEFGEFFPKEMSPFPYGDTVSSDYYKILEKF